MNKSRFHILLLLLFVSVNSNSQIIKNDAKLFKEKIIFIDTITIENPIIIKYEFTKRYKGLYFWKKYNNRLFFISSKAYYLRLTNKDFTIDSLNFSDICYSYLSIVSYFQSAPKEIKNDYLYSSIYNIFQRDYTWDKRAIQHFNREYLITNNKGLSYSKLKTNRFAIFLIRQDYFSGINRDINTYYRVAIPIELGDKEPAVFGGVNPLID